MRGNIDYDQLRSGGVAIKSADYTAIDTDAWKLIIFNTSSSPVVTHTLKLPNPPPVFGTSAAVWKLSVANIGLDALNVSPNGLLIDGGASSVALSQNQGLEVYTDGTNYFSNRGVGSSIPGGSITLKTNGVLNGSQSILNLVAGSGMSLSDNGSGSVTLTASGGSGIPPWYTITDPTTTTFAWRNQGGATVTNRSQSIYLLGPTGAGVNLRGREVAAGAAPFSVTLGFIPQEHNQNFNGMGLYVTDGTKLCTVDCYNSNTLAVHHWTNVTTVASTVVNPNLSVGPGILFFKIQDDGTNLNFSWSVNGQDFIQLSTELRLSFLASIANFGFFVDPENATWPDAMLVVSWKQGT